MYVYDQWEINNNTCIFNDIHVYQNNECGCIHVPVHALVPENEEYHIVNACEITYTVPPWAYMYYIGSTETVVNPRRACAARVTVLSLSVCVCVRV